MVKKVRDFQASGLAEHMAEHRHYSPADIDAILKTVPGGLPAVLVDIQQAAPDGGGLIPCEVDRRSALTGRLEAIAEWYFMSRKGGEKPSPSELAKRFQAIETAARELLEALRLPKSGDPDEIPQALLVPLRQRAEAAGARIGGFPHHRPMEWRMEGGNYMDYFGSAALREAVGGVKYLHAWASEAKGMEREHIRPGDKRNKGDEPMRDLFRDLVGIWVEILKKPVKMSVGAPERKNEGRPAGPMLAFIRACLKPLGIDASDDAIRERIKPFQRMVKSSLWKS
jgi:hypothetical protein